MDMKYGKSMIVKKSNFDRMLKAILRAKPIPRKAIKSSAKSGPKTPILAER